MSPFGQLLVCPSCGFDYVHHVRVVVRSRETEDHEGAVATVGGGVCSVARCGVGFAGRRDDIEIECTCENGCTFTVMLVQHKGHTYLSSDAGTVRLEVA